MSDTVCEAKVKGLLKAALKRKNVTYVQLVEKLAVIDVVDTEPNISGVLDPMPTGYRLVLATLGGLILLMTFSYGYYLAELNYPQQERYQPYRYAADKPEEVDPALPRPAGAKPFEYRAPCYKPEGHDESDLCAQWKAARAAEASALWTARGFWIAIVGSALLLWQIALTRKAVEDTSEATEAMREANKIARETAYLDRRAWIVVNVATDRKLSFLPGVHTVVRIDLTNIGKQPAFDVAAWATLYTDKTNGLEALPIVKNDLMLRVGFMRALATKNRVSRTILPGQTISIRPDVTCGPAEGMIGRIIACAQYLIGDDKAEHHAIAGFDLTSFQEDGSNRVIFPSEGDLAQDRLRIEPSGFVEAT